jgi:hypothetical protein
MEYLFHFSDLKLKHEQAKRVSMWVGDHHSLPVFILLLTCYLQNDVRSLGHVGSWVVIGSLTTTIWCVSLSRGAELLLMASISKPRLFDNRRCVLLCR